MNRIIIYMLTTAAAVLMLSCGDGTNGGDNYGNLIDSPLGLILTPHEHVGGWGRSDCFVCHPLENIHLVNRTSLPGIDMAEVRNMTIVQGLASCPTCHGPNGVGTGTSECLVCHTGGVPD